MCAVTILLNTKITIGEFPFDGRFCEHCEHHRETSHDMNAPFSLFFVKNHSFPFGFFFVSEQFHVPVVLCISEGGGIHWRRRAYSIISPDLRTESQARPAYENLFGKKVDIGVSAPSNNTSIKRFFSSISFLLGCTMSFRWTPWMGRCAAVGPTGRA